MNANTDFTALDFIEAPATMDSWDMLMDFVAAQSARHLSDPQKSYGMRLAAEEILSNMMRETKSPSQNQATITINIIVKLGLKLSAMNLKNNITK